MISASVGANINAGNYMLTIIISFIAVIGFAMGMLYKNKIIKSLSKENVKILKFNKYKSNYKPLKRRKSYV
jgi:hypothetical protein